MNKFTVDKFRDGSVVLSCGDKGMETDLVFASGCTEGDPFLSTQLAMLEYIAERMNADSPLDRIESKLDQLLAKKKTRKRKEVEYSLDFEEAWENYPRRCGSNSKGKAFSAWNGRIRNNKNEWDAMISGANRYRAFCDATGKTNTEYVMQAATFFGPEKHYLESWDIPITQETLPRDNDEMVHAAELKGFRSPRPGESYAQYRKAAEAILRTST